MNARRFSGELENCAIADVSILCIVSEEEFGPGSAGGDGGGVKPDQLQHAHIPHVDSCAIVERSADRDDPAVAAQRDCMTIPVARGLAIDVSAELRPRASRVPVHAHMPGAIVQNSADRDDRAVAAQGDCMTRPVARGLAIDVSAELRPRAARVLVHAHMPRVGSRATVTISADRDDRAVAAQRDCMTRPVARGLAIDVSAELRPRAARVLEHAHMPRVGSCAIVTMSADRDDRAVAAQGDCTTRPVARGLAIDVSAELRPRASRVLEHAHMPRVGCCAIVIISADRDDRAVAAQRNCCRTSPRPVARGLAVDVSAELRPRASRVLVNAHMPRPAACTNVELSADRDDRAVAAQRD
eukprot:CAMPEP_0113246324 /NCGR_PEP_ID=MMETSP0008_2-20120614/9406_1 /TAXON_ID=97485 /ORGANISM="Prymnesium parvum" /LENGTH=355 /DNA_ID=CAMNT_0000094065 /DNA_START=352 /DNA_END=1419 /DNA_ORIENTATION=- /assembly_acc=CAM_ASM_000153